MNLYNQSRFTSNEVLLRNALVLLARLASPHGQEKLLILAFENLYRGVGSDALQKDDMKVLCLITPYKRP